MPELRYRVTQWSHRPKSSYHYTLHCFHQAERLLVCFWTNPAILITFVLQAKIVITFKLQAKKKKLSDFRSSCPISSALDIMGDKWTLLIIRDLSLFAKRTFREFSDSPEHIATNILSDRLKRLEEFGVITKGKMPNNRKTVVYALTDKGIDLVPILAEIVLWGSRHLDFPIQKDAQSLANKLLKDKKGTVERLRKGLTEAANK